ncbi:MAG: hypothetical protein ABIJ97_13140 [Bacteroidota bacterium]
MRNSKTYKTTLVSILFIWFMLFDLVVYFSKNKKKSLINKKIKMGALILSFSAFMTTQSYSQKTCYIAVTSSGNNFAFKNEFSVSTGELVVDLKKDTRLLGFISDRNDTVFSYTIHDISGSLIAEGSVVALDGSFNSEKEEFFINMFNIQSGKYKLQLYSGINRKNPENIFDLEVKNQPKVINTCYY